MGGPRVSIWSNQLSGPTDPAADARWPDAAPRVGFFTDTSICIGCKACEVACKTWNALPADGLAFSGHSYDNSLSLGATTWRHVAFIEQVRPEASPVADGEPAPPPGAAPVRWLMSSDVCKHCTHAGCLDVCPTGALFRTEYGTVVVQNDVCNGCGYCVPACPFGVIDKRRPDEHPAQDEDPRVGIAQKCTLCYDRLRADQTPACAQACPTTSITFGPLDELRQQAAERVATLHGRGVSEAQLYGADELDGVGGTGSIFLLLDEPEVYGLPPDPIVPTADLPDIFRRAGQAGLAMLGAVALAFLTDRRRP
ncbi:MAG: 4Fe-4S dicluster domain-containing protein [Austwickia sp.]|nr:4Fe-4S dicluster domain-containing protein [Austwickia sp.]